jgi:hypothetical protein
MAQAAHPVAARQPLSAVKPRVRAHDCPGSAASHGQLTQLSDSIGRSPRVQAQRMLTTQINQGRPVAQTKSSLQALSASSNVIQRFVPLGLEKGTKVRIIRSTSKEFHGEMATIVGPGEKENEYLVSVDSTSEQVFARTDQLQPPQDPLPNEGPVQVDFSEIEGKGVDEILEMVSKLVQAKLEPKHPFVVGGSFSAFLYALKKGQFVRTPRDIDIIMNPLDFREQGGPKSLKGVLFCGIPLELHQAGRLVNPKKEETEAGILSPGTLLAQHLKKLRDQQFRFKAVIPKATSGVTAVDVLKIMRQHNDAFMKMKDGEPDHMGDNSKRVWIKTLTDIETLAAIGAVVA